ncbi:MAG: DUF1127 domain-containing protein [Kiloniellales bacterium]|nr:DUF1127 domain-containing protein [Kiloniellales bacterium]
MHTISQHQPPAGAWTASGRLFSPFAVLSRAVVKVVQTLLVWDERHVQRRALASLDDAMLKDMGLSRADAEREASKPFWRA